jgi:hypothetical protein
VNTYLIRVPIKAFPVSIDCGVGQPTPPIGFGYPVSFRSNLLCESSVSALSKVLLHIDDEDSLAGIMVYR